MFVEFVQLLLEVDVSLLILFAALAVIICPHLAIITTVVLKHVTEGLYTFGLLYEKDDQNRDSKVTYVDFIKFCNECEGSREICLE